MSLNKRDLKKAKREKKRKEKRKFLKLRNKQEASNHRKEKKQEIHNLIASLKEAQTKAMEDNNEDSGA